MSIGTCQQRTAQATAYLFFFFRRCECFAGPPSAPADSPEWLTQLAAIGCEAWAGLRLGGRSRDRPLLLTGRGSLLQLRTYLFSRQCTLLLRLGQPWEMAARCLPFLQHTVHELRSLEVKAPKVVSDKRATGHFEAGSCVGV